MNGPKPKGYWTANSAPNCGKSYGLLSAGQRYRVTRQFSDFDGSVHPEGEMWVFRGYSFLPYDDGLSFFVSFTDEEEWHIRMQLRPEQQAQIIDDLSKYIERIN